MPNLIDWADAIFSSGGDGTFLLAASKVQASDMPVIGINSDPGRLVVLVLFPIIVC